MFPVLAGFAGKLLGALDLFKRVRSAARDAKRSFSRGGVESGLRQLARDPNSILQRGGTLTRITKSGRTVTAPDGKVTATGGTGGSVPTGTATRRRRRGGRNE